MPVALLSDEALSFPPVHDAREDGLLAIGGDLSPERLLLAYRSGIFPWYGDGEMPMWWSPHPRFVLFPDELKISKSMRQVLNRGEFLFSLDTAFETVITYCSAVERKDQDGTWISDDIIRGYTALHKLGYAHSAEAWHNGALAGGLYGVRLGSAFFGESMFSLRANASKFAFIKMVQRLQDAGIRIIDCQVYTPHLQSLGARMISREEFLGLISS